MVNITLSSPIKQNENTAAPFVLQYIDSLIRSLFSSSNANRTSSTYLYVAEKTVIIHNYVKYSVHDY